MGVVLGIAADKVTGRVKEKKYGMYLEKTGGTMGDITLLNGINLGCTYMYQVNHGDIFTNANILGVR